VSQSPSLPENDLIIPVFSLVNDVRMRMDDAIDLGLEALRLPLLGGPSGFGWTYIAAAQKCPHLFWTKYDAPEEIRRERETQAPRYELQIGGLFHALQALYYGHGLGERVAYVDRGIATPTDAMGIVDMRTGVGPTAADDLIAWLKARCRAAEEKGDATFGPNYAYVLEGERLFDYHANWWGNGGEDVEPLAIEWKATHPELGYTCRYDMIGKVGKFDPQCSPGVYIYERKTTKWLSEYATDGWALDGEVMGELLCWEASGMADLFGPLKGICIDLTTKEGKQPKCHRIVLPPKMPAVENFKRWIMYDRAQIAQWRATGVYPQRFASCLARGICDEYANCQKFSWQPVR
jgi:hypothetical protein